MKKIYIALIVGMLVLGLSGVALADTLITFDEFPVGTVISNQYAGLGVYFMAGYETGRLPQISWNGAMPTQPVLRPTGEPDYYYYQGDFWMYFTTPAHWVQFDSGYWDVAGTGQILLFDPSANLILATTNLGTGPETRLFDFAQDIRWIYFNSIKDPAGADIDNLSFNVPEPGTLLLLGFGLISLVGLRRKFWK